MAWSASSPLLARRGSLHGGADPVQGPPTPRQPPPANRCALSIETSVNWLTMKQHRLLQSKDHLIITIKNARTYGATSPSRILSDKSIRGAQKGNHDHRTHHHSKWRFGLNYIVASAVDRDPESSFEVRLRFRQPLTWRPVLSLLTRCNPYESRLRAVLEMFSAERKWKPEAKQLCRDLMNSCFGTTVLPYLKLHNAQTETNKSLASCDTRARFILYFYTVLYKEKATSSQ